jgi:anti-sigma B factor antagonist
MAIDEAELARPAEFSTEVRELPGLTIMELSGELDLSTAGALREALLMLELDGGLGLEIDLRGLSFLGSTGIGVIVAACKRVRASGGTFSVSCDHNLVRRVIEVAGLVDFLELHDAEDSHPNQRRRETEP